MTRHKSRHNVVTRLLVETVVRLVSNNVCLVVRTSVLSPVRTLVSTPRSSQVRACRALHAAYQPPPPHLLTSLFSLSHCAGLLAARRFALQRCGCDAKEGATTSVCYAVWTEVVLERKKRSDKLCPARSVAALRDAACQRAY